MNEAKLNKWICVVILLIITIGSMYLKLIKGFAFNYLFIIALIFVISVVVSLPKERFAPRNKD